MKRWINVVTLVFSLVLNTLAVTLPLNGIDTGSISDRLDVPFTPAGYVFSIWSLIYLTLIIWTLLQFKKDRQDSPVYTETHYLFWLINILNGVWLVTWHYFYFGIGVIIMVLLLFTLIAMYKKVQHRKAHGFDLVPFSLYLGWISVATIANISYFLTDIGWNGFGVSAEIWTVGLLILALILATWFRYSQADVIFPLVFVWALIGVGIENQAASSLVSSTAFIVVGIILVMIFVARKKKETLSFRSKGVEKANKSFYG